MSTLKQAPLVDEQTFYNQCTQYYHTKATPSENTTLTHILLTIAEKKDGLQFGCAVVDPGMPDRISGAEAFKLNIAQHLATRFSEPINEVIGKLAKETMQMRSVREAVGEDIFDGTLEASDGPDEFRDNLLETLETLPTLSKLQLLLKDKMS